MAKYKKRPVVIEAFRYDGDLKDSKGNWYVPDWMVEAFENGIAYYELPLSPLHPPDELYIKTLEGNHHVSVGDYVICGVNGSLITPRLKKEKVAEIFTCYEEKVTITKKHSLQE